MTPRHSSLMTLIMMEVDQVSCTHNTHVHVDNSSTLKLSSAFNPHAIVLFYHLLCKDRIMQGSSSEGNFMRKKGGRERERERERERLP